MRICMLLNVYIRYKCYAQNTHLRGCRLNSHRQIQLQPTARAPSGGRANSRASHTRTRTVITFSAFACVRSIYKPLIRRRYARCPARARSCAHANSEFCRYSIPNARHKILGQNTRNSIVASRARGKTNTHSSTQTNRHSEFRASFRVFTFQACGRVHACISTELRVRGCSVCSFNALALVRHGQAERNERGKRFGVLLSEFVYILEECLCNSRDCRTIQSVQTAWSWWII